MSMKISITFFLLYCVFSVDGFSQNLISNGGFEEYVDCPVGLPDLQAVGWSYARGSCDYYNVCDQPLGVSIPHNVFGWQHPLIGNAYIGCITSSTQDLSLREIVGIGLVESLAIGETYYYSMYVSNANNGEHITHASNGHGALFSMNEYSAINTVPLNPDGNPTPISNNPQILNSQIISDTTNWVQIKGSFVADSAYSFVSIGGFLDSTLIEMELVNGDFEEFGCAYYYFDEVRLSADSVFAFEELITHVPTIPQQDISIFPNPTEDIVYIYNQDRVHSISVFNMFGQHVLEMENSNLGILHLNGIPSGSYIIHIITREGRFINKSVIKL